MANLRSVYILGLRTSIRYNSAAYGYSVMITATFAALSRLEGGASVPYLFLFVGGAASAFTIVEAAGTNFFRERARGDRPEVVILGSAFAFVAIAAGLGVAAACGWLMGSWPAWIVGPFAATLVYLLVLGVELMLAHQVEARQRKNG